MNEFIYENDSSIESFVCNKIIDFFEKNEKKTLRRQSVLIVEFSDKYTAIQHCLSYLNTELTKNIQEYMVILHNKHIVFSKMDAFSIKNVTIRKFNANKGFLYDDNNSSVSIMRKKKIITFLWFLTDVEEGGELQISDHYTIKPKKGKMVLFPSEGLFAYRLEIPQSQDSYVLIGCVYQDL